MNETLKNLRARLIDIWTGWSQRQRRNIVISVSLLLVCFAVVLWVVLRPNYVVVMSGLDASSLGQVQTKLADLKIPNEIQGSSVLVPQKDADTARIQLATAGLPKQGYIGYSSIPNSFGMTQDQYNMQVLDVLQQSLDQTIENIDGVVSAQVHIVMPEQQLFVSDNQQNTAKASVFVQVGNGVQLSGAQVAGIQQLVAHSVKGLSTDNVSVVDQNGVTLSQANSDNGTGATDSSEISMRNQLEQQMNDKLTSGLAQIVGPGNAVVVVHANVTFNQTQSTTQNVLPAPGQTTGLITTQHITRSSNNSGTSSAGGPAGQASSNPNLPTYAGSSGGAGNSTSSSTDQSTTYANGTQTIQTTADPIQLNGYRVSVLLNSQDKSLTPQVVNQIKSFVNNAIGPGNASNSVSVTSVPFQAQPGIPAITHSRIWLWVGVGVAILLLILGLLLFMRRRSDNGVQEGGASRLIPIDELPDEPLAQNVNEDEQMRKQLANLANQKPEEFANLVRTWLVSE